MSFLTEEEKEDIKKTGDILTDDQLSDTLDNLFHREVLLLDGELGHGEMREITLHNITVLAAASALIRTLKDREV